MDMNFTKAEKKTVDTISDFAKSLSVEKQKRLLDFIFVAKFFEKEKVS